MKVSAEILNLIPYKPGKPISETQREYGLTEVIKLASNENALGPSPKAVEAAQRYLTQQHRYPDPSCYDLVQKIAEKWNVPASQVAIGNGSNEIIDLLIRIFCEPGDAILTSQAAFVAYQVCAQAARVKVKTTPLRADLTIDLKALADYFFHNPTAGIRMIFIPNPNNPTGTYISFDEVKRLHAGLPSHVVLVLDAAYAEYVRKNDYASGIELVSTNENVVMTRTFSKIHGLAALHGADLEQQFPVRQQSRGQRVAHQRLSHRAQQLHHLLTLFTLVAF